MLLAVAQSRSLPCACDESHDQSHDECGRNLIAECGVAAAIGIKSAMEAAGGHIGQVSVANSYHPVAQVSLPRYRSCMWTHLDRRVRGGSGRRSCGTGIYNSHFNMFKMGFQRKSDEICITCCARVCKFPKIGMDGNFTLPFVKDQHQALKVL